MVDHEFVERMAHELRQNAGKGDWRVWVDHDATEWNAVLSELDHHVAKLKKAIEDGCDISTIREYAADIANNGMFAWRFARRSHERQEQQKANSEMGA